MPTGSEQPRGRAPLMIWWIIWGLVLAGLGLIRVVAGAVNLPASQTADQVLLNLVGFAPLFMSIVIRWLMLPRCLDLRRAFPMFVVGLALAEACGLLGLFLGGPYQEDLFILGVMGILQFMPFFAKKYLDPKPNGYIPNH